MNVPLIGEDSRGELQQVKVQTNTSSQTNSSRSLVAMLRRGSDLRVPVAGRMLLVLICLFLGSCGSFSGYVSDHWPTWAGGMPKDVPPRPGAPGYDEFMAHQQGRDAAMTSPPADTNSQPTAVVSSPNKVSGQAPPVNQPRNNSSVVQSGLY
jgi:hypothetical protein